MVLRVFFVVLGLSIGFLVFSLAFFDCCFFTIIGYTIVVSYNVIYDAKYTSLCLYSTSTKNNTHTEMAVYSLLNTK